jgi:hypothetical protein
LWWFAMEHALSLSSTPATTGWPGGGGGEKVTGVPTGGGGGEGDGGGDESTGVPTGGGGDLTAEHAGPDMKNCSCDEHATVP